MSAGGWNVVASAPAKGDGWNVVSATPASPRPAGLPAGVDLPGLPAPAQATVSIPAPVGVQRLIGDGGRGVIQNAGAHLKNLVAGPYHAFTDAPKNSEEQQIKGTSPDSGAPAKVLGQIGLGAARMLVQPTRIALREASKQAHAGNLAGNEYDAEGNYTPNAVGSVADALPIIGPLARNFDSEARQQGLLPAMAGAAVDFAAPKLAGKGVAALRGMAPSLAEGALKISAADRGYGKTIGRAALDETTGIRPSTILQSTTDRLKQLNPQVDAMAAAHGGPVSIQPAVDSVVDTQLKHAVGNDEGSYHALEPVREQLTVNHFGNSQPFAAPTVGNPNTALAPLQTASAALALKRGLRNQFVKNFSLDSASGAAKDAAKSASGAIDQSLDGALGPDFAGVNQRISSLIPVQDAAEKLTRSAEIPQALGSKLGKHTGALTGAAAGGAAFGPLGAAAGFALPEMLSSPAAQMALARTLNSRLPATLIPPLFGGGVLTPRKATP